MPDSTRVTDQELQNTIDIHVSLGADLKDRTLRALLDLQASRERERELMEALKALLYQVNNIEVLGEWSALDMNRLSGKKLRAEVDATVTKCREALARAEAKDKQP